MFALIGKNEKKKRKLFLVYLNMFTLNCFNIDPTVAPSEEPTSVPTNAPISLGFCHSFFLLVFLLLDSFRMLIGKRFCRSLCLLVLWQNIYVVLFMNGKC